MGKYDMIENRSPGEKAGENKESSHCNGVWELFYGGNWGTRKYDMIENRSPGEKSRENNK